MSLVRGVLQESALRGLLRGVFMANGAGVAAFAFSVVPSISGNSTQGSILTGGDGVVAGGTAPYTYTYQWFRGATNLGAGERASSYTIKATTIDTIGAVLTRVTTVTDSLGATASSTSNAITVTALPFISDANTLWFDFTNAANTIDNIGYNTVSYIPEKIKATNALVQNVKDLEPIQETNGISFRQGTQRFLSFESTAGITNATNGYYFGENIFIPSDTTAVENDIINIKAVTGNTSSRGRLAYNSTGKVNFQIDTTLTDSATLSTAFLQSATLVKNAWYTVEVYVSLATGACALLINRVSTATATITTGAFPASNPNYITFGNANSLANPTSTSQNGTTKEFIFQNAAPTTPQLASWTAYLNDIRIQVPLQTTITASTGNGFINLAIPANSVGNGNSPITNHQLRFKIAGGAYTTISTGSATPPTTLTNAGITNDTEYFVSHLRTNAIGDSDWSSDVPATPTANPGVPSAITTLSVVAGDTQLLVFWTKPSANGYTISGHKVSYRVTGSGGVFTPWATIATGAGTLTTTITGLTNATSYEVDVRSTNSQGDSAAASPTVSKAPVAAANIQNIVASAVADYDLTVAASYGGSGTTLNSLVASPADGSTKAANALVFGDGATATTYPTFSGTAGTPSGVLTFDGGDMLSLTGSANTAFYDALHKTTSSGTTNMTAQPFTVLAFYETLVTKASNQVLMATKNGSTQIGVTCYINSSAAAPRIEQGNGATLTAAPTQAITLGSNKYLGFGVEVGTATNNFKTWSSSITSVTGTRTFGATNAAASNKVVFMAQAISATGSFAVGTKLKALCVFNTLLTNAQVELVRAEYSTRHGVTY